MRGLGLVVVGLLLGTCTPSSEPAPAAAAGPPASASCPTAPILVESAPDVRPEHHDPEFWLRKLGPAADEVVLDEASIAELNRAALELDGAWRDVLSDDVGDQDRVGRDLVSRTRWMQKRLAVGEHVEGRPGSFAAAAAVVDSATMIDELRVISAESQLWCVPLRDGVFSGSGAPDPDFDRNRCSSLHTGELVRALRRSFDGTWWQVHAGHSVGWLEAPTWTPPLPAATAAAFRDQPPRLSVLDDHLAVDGLDLRLGTSFPIVAEDERGWTVQVPLATGLATTRVSTQPGYRAGPLPFSRRHVFELALGQLGAPYGWGGRAGERDCSAFLYDELAVFGLRLARHSSVQAQLGTHSISLAGLDEPTKRQRIRAAAQRGVVLLHMPGHIMLYLGQDGAHDYGVSSLSEMLAPCSGGPDTVYRLDRVAVTTLDVGRGSERTAFIERIDRMAVFGP